MRIVDHTGKVIAALDRAAARAMTRTGMDLQREIRKSMKSLGPRVGGSRPHSPKGEGAPPAVQIGNLRRSIAYDVVGSGMGSSVRVGVPGGTEEGTYGAILELTTHPFIKPVIKGKSKLAQKYLAEEMSKL